MGVGGWKRGSPSKWHSLGRSLFPLEPCLASSLSRRVGCELRLSDLDYLVAQQTCQCRPCSNAACQKSIPAQGEFDEEDASCRPRVRALFALACQCSRYDACMWAQRRKNASGDKQSAALTIRICHRHDWMFRSATCIPPACVHDTLRGSEATKIFLDCMNSIFIVLAVHFDVTIRQVSPHWPEWRSSVLFEVALFGGWASETDAVQSPPKLSEDERCWSAQYDCCQRSGALLRRGIAAETSNSLVCLALRRRRYELPARPLDCNETFPEPCSQCDYIEGM